MAIKLNILSARQVATETTPGKHADGGGLFLHVRARGVNVERAWIFKYKRGERGATREHWIGLGAARNVSLAAAREMARVCREALAMGEDPKLALNREKDSVPTFGAFADALIADLAPGFKSPITTRNWERTLGDAYCASLRRMPVADIKTEHVLAALRPVWQAKPETARRVRARIEMVLDAAKAQGLREGENPARWRGHLSLMLARHGKLTRRHHPALPWKDLPGFMLRLRALQSVSALALEFSILTVARTGMTIAARRSEVKDRVWTVPRDRMKNGEVFRVPLCNRAMAILEETAVFGGDYIFPARDPRKHLSNMAMAKCLEGLDDENTVHGFRSTFRDWVHEATQFPRELAEIAMAHEVGDDVERAYMRGDALDRRRPIMEAWERYCRGQTRGVLKLVSVPTPPDTGIKQRG